ncbi:MAG: type II secretion system minor pseudopilin GspJ [Gammaproteobacteria bacterium]
MPARNRVPHGFTLLELLIAVAILSLIAVGAYTLLSDTVRVRERGQVHQQQLRDLQKAMMLIQRDLQQATPRAIRDEYGDVQPALYLPQQNVLEFSRRGWRNPLQQTRSELVRLRYRAEGGELLRERWDVLDRARLTQPERIVLLDNISEFSVQVVAEGSRSDSWPRLSQASEDRKTAGMPQAVEVAFRHETFGLIRRIILLPNGELHANAPKG